MISCTIVIPCYNEAGRLPTGEFQGYLAESPGVSLLFVNDGSTDSTLRVLQELRKAMPERIGILDLEKNSGKGEAVRNGMRSAIRKGAKFVGFWDADLATPLSAIADLQAILLSNPEVDVVFGSRVKLLGRNIERRAMRHYLGRAFATCAAVVLRLEVYDTQCGAKLFRVTPELEAVLSEPFSSRWIFDVEIIARFLRLRAAGSKPNDNVIYEFPLYSWRDVPGSKVRFKDFFRSAIDLYKIRRRYFGTARRHDEVRLAAAPADDARKSEANPESSRI
jgi:glycosyltransferase involved in cell wall biosynthesis